MRKPLLAPAPAVWLLAAALSQADQPAQPPPLPADYAQVRDRVLLSPREQSYRTIAWRTSVLRGVVDAQAADRPVLIVLMNGHPLGCT